MTEPVLRIENLTTQIGHGKDIVTPVSDLSLEIRAGETWALLGESGCGKSMTALSIMRLLPGSGRILDGSIRLLGNELLDNRTSRQVVRYSLHAQHRQNELEAVALTIRP